MLPKPFRHTLPVRFDDVDHAGIVYYPRFFHYFHLTFEEFFRERVGARAYAELLDQRRIGFPAVSTECEYSAPLRFGDEVIIELSVERIGGRSVGFCYRASTTQGPVAVARVVCAVVDLDKFQSVTVPDDLRELFGSLRSGA